MGTVRHPYGAGGASSANVDSPHCLNAAVAPLNQAASIHGAVMYLCRRAWGRTRPLASAVLPFDAAACEFRLLVAGQVLPVQS